MIYVAPDGTELTLEEIQRAIMRITNSEELKLFGRPMPALTDIKHKVIVANRIPGRERFNYSFGEENFEKDGAKYVNSWPVLGHDVIVFQDQLGLSIARIPHAQWKLTNIFQSMVLRLGSITAKAELKAIHKLSTHINENQFDCYMLSNCFIEKSKRSGVTYMFRKNHPTLAMRVMDKDSRCLAALCMHPMGYFEGTSAGCMAPTDEVIAHLTMMRGDEHFFWRKSNQHKTRDARSGV